MRVLLVIVALTLTGCASRFASDSERDAAIQPWKDCVDHAVERLDDGKSDPLSIAYGVQPACSFESAQVEHMMDKGMTSVQTLMYAQTTWHEHELKLITSAVLTYRASHESPPNSAATSNGDGGIWAAATAADNRHDYATEFALLRPLAEQGDATAQAGIAMLYAFGNGVPEDDAEAVAWLRKAADQKNGGIATAGAKGALGLMYESGRGVPKDYVQAYKWFNLGAADGDDRSVKDRDRVKEFLTAGQIAEAQRQSAIWQPNISPNVHATAKRNAARGSALARASHVSPKSPDGDEFQRFDQWQTQGDAK
jgi:hypothetical protein